MLVRRSSGSVTLTAIDRDAVLTSLRETAGRIASGHPEVREIILFGSIAQGTETGRSDVDILIVVGSSNVPYVLRSIGFRKYFELEVPVDILVCTVDEIDAMLRQGNPFIKHIREEGMALLPRSFSSR